MTIDPDEAVRIIEDIRKSGCALPAPILDRILAAANAKPKGPWPLDLKDTQIMANIHHSSTLLLTCYEDDEEVTFGLTQNDMDRLWVAWSQHRGVDLHRLCQLGRWGCDSELTARYDCCEQCDLSHIAHAIQPILDNAEGEA